MKGEEIAPYGAWRSPITAESIAYGGVRLGAAVADGDTIYWSEGRAVEGGRQVIVAMRPDGTRRDAIPTAFNARTRVHEYGGGAWAVKDDVLVFSNFVDNHLYRVDGEAVSALTGNEAMYYADLCLDLARNRLICIREDHSAVGEAVNTLVSLPLRGVSEGEVLVSGNDFYAYPRLSPDGSRLAYITWCHPNMPWNGSELYVADVRSDGTLGDSTLVAGGPEESILQPEWSTDGTLYLLSDRTGWWNLYRTRNGDTEPITSLDAEIGGPLWGLGSNWYCLSPDGRAFCVVDRASIHELIAVDATSRAESRIPLPYTGIDAPAMCGDDLLLSLASPTDPNFIGRLDLRSGDVNVIVQSDTRTHDAAYISVPQSIEFPTTKNAVAYGWYYPPRNADFRGPDGALSPLVVMSHGGPTGERGPELNLSVQFWTSRGFAVLDVNYRGSSGFGRPYREALDGNWGVDDVDDCIAGAQYLVGRGLVDGNALLIRGGSAGGYTTLCALTFRDVFAAGASHYGIGDLIPFVDDTHKFESRYLDKLIGPYPQRADLYRERSPLNYTGQISTPMIILQGLDDKVVPPNQAEMVVAALRKKGLPLAYVAYPGEGHGFRKAENVKHSLEAELYFYSRVLGFDAPDIADPVPIENMA